MKTKVVVLKRLIVPAVLLLSLLVPLVAGCAGPAEEAPIVAGEKTIKVGLMMTFTGALSGAGYGACTGLMDHLRWMNKEGGIEYKDPATGETDTVLMDLSWEDSQYDPARSVAAYKRFKAAGVQMIVDFGSTPGEAIAASCSADKIPCYDMYCYPSPAGYTPQPQYYIASFPSISEEVVLHSTWFLERWKADRAPRIFALALGLPSWRVLEQGAPIEPIAALGGEYLGYEFFSPTVPDFTVVLKRVIDEEKADCIVFFPQPANTATALRNLRSMGKELGVGPGKVTLTVAQCGHDESLFNLSSDLLDGTIAELSAATTADADLPGVKLAVEQVGPWAGRSLEEITQLYLTGFGQAYVTRAWIKDTLEAVGYDAIDGPALRDALFNLKDVDCGGVLYPVSVRCPEYPTLVYWERFAKMVVGEGYTEVSDWMRAPDLTKGRW